MNTNKIEIKKHSAIIQMSNRVTLQQRKAFNALLYVARTILKEKPADHIFTINIETIKKLAGVDANNNKQIKESLESLDDIKIEYNILSKDNKKIWGKFALLAGIEIKEGIVKFNFPFQIYETLLRPDMYAFLDLNIIKGLTSKYAIALYEISKDYINVEIPAMSIEKVRELFGIEETQYKNNAILKLKVLDIAVREINEKTDLNVSYTEITTGRKITGIKFTVTKKKIDIKLLTAPIEESLQDDVNDIFNNLLDVGVSKLTVKTIIKNYSPENIKKQMDWLEYRKPRDPAAMLIQAIKEEWSIPNELLEGKQKEEAKNMLENAINNASDAEYIILPSGKRFRMFSIQENGYIEIIGDDNKKYMVQPSTVCQSTFE